MLIAPTLPTVAELVDRALADTDFVAEITANQPHELRICAELAAERAAEAWERAAGLPVCSLPPALTDQVAGLLLRQGTSLRETGQSTLSGRRAMLEGSIADLVALRRGIRCSLPPAGAGALMADLESKLDSISVALCRALDALDATIEDVPAAVPCRSEAV